tara:strand:- start:403 stop:531 length:129 start_codon:yes stop_codon:yes gene_type:complete
MRILELIIDYIPDWVWAGLGGIIGLGLFALAMLLGDYLNSIQ